MTQVGCKWMSAHMDEYLSGGCSDEERESAELHLAVCVECFENVQLWSFLKGEVPRAPLPPLSELTERRILSTGSKAPLHGLRIERVRPSAVRMGIAAAAAALIVLGIGFLLLSRSESTHSAVPPAVVARQAAVPTVLPTLMPTPEYEGDAEIQSARDGKRYIDVFPGTTLWLAEDATVEVKAVDETQARFHLIRGSAVAEIGPVPSGFRFVVTTATQEIEARGTVFTVETDDSGASSVRVAEGTVEVRYRDRRRKPQVIKAGQALGLLDEAPTSAPQEALAADLAFIAPSSSLAVPALEETSLAPPMPDSRAQRVGVQKTEGHRSSQGPTELLDLAQEFRRSGAWGPASSTYEKIIAAYPDSTAADISLVSLGQLYLTGISDPGRASLYFNRYLTKTPRGNLRAAALSGNVRALAHLRQHKAVIEGAAAYLADYPDGGAAPEMFRRRGDALAALGRTGDAAHDYSLVISRWPDSAEAKRARKGLARCTKSP